MPSSALQTLLSTVENELSEILQKEEDERQRIEDERRRREGGFPTLQAAAAAASSTNLAAQGGLPPTQYKVLSLNSKTKKPTVTSFSEKPRATPSSSRTASRAESPADLEAGLPPRIPPPPDEVVVEKIPPAVARDRPWYNARENVLYVEPARI